MSQLVTSPITKLGQLDGPHHFRRTVEDTATMATIIGPVTLRYATSTAQASLQSTTLGATSEWSRDDAYGWLSQELRKLYRYDEGWKITLKRYDALYVVDTGHAKSTTDVDNAGLMFITKLIHLHLEVRSTKHCIESSPKRRPRSKTLDK